MVLQARIQKEFIEPHCQKRQLGDTDVPVNTVLPDSVLRALEATPKVTPNHYFWEGPYIPLPRHVRLELLFVGVPIERVSVLLAHQSIKVNEKLYSFPMGAFPPGAVGSRSDEHMESRHTSENGRYKSGTDAHEDSVSPCKQS